MAGQFVDKLESRTYFSGSNFFPIGVFSQPTSSFATWQGRGVNTLVAAESQGGAVSVDQWAAAADAANLYQIRQPTSDLKADTRNHRLLAWFQPDEPEVNGTAPSLLASNAASWRAVKNAKPIFTNFSGSNLLDGNTSADVYNQYLPSTDWVGSDLYPVTGWGRTDWIDYGQTPPDRRMNEGLAVKAFGQLSAKPQFAFIETSNQQLSYTAPGTRGVTAAEFRGEVWDAVIHGAKGIIYFPQQFNGFSYDATPPEVVSEMGIQDTRLKALAPAINSAADSNDPALQMPNLASPALEGTVRVLNGQRYYFVLNMSNQNLTNQELDVAGLVQKSRATVVGEARSIKTAAGYFNDNFAPFEMHVYRLANSSVGTPIVVIPPPLPTPIVDVHAFNLTLDLLGSATEPATVLN